MSIVVFERSVSRLRELINVEDVHRFYRDLMALPFFQFANCRLLLPCIVHRVHGIIFKHKDINNHVYEAQVTNLKPLMITTLDELVSGMSQEASPYVVVRVLDQNLLETVKDDEDDAAYATMGVSSGGIARIGDFRGITSSKITTLNTV